MHTFSVVMAIRRNFSVGENQVSSSWNTETAPKVPLELKALPHNGVGFRKPPKGSLTVGTRYSSQIGSGGGASGRRRFSRIADIRMIHF